MIGIGLIGADYLLIRRSTNRVVDTLLKRPAILELNRLLNDPRMAQIAVKVIDIIECSHHFLTSLPHEFSDSQYQTPVREEDFSNPSNPFRKSVDGKEDKK